MRNKCWFQDRFQQVVQKNRRSWPDGTVLQIGTKQDLPLQGVYDLRGKTSLRQAAAILTQCECFIGTSGLLSHLARAVDCRSIVIYGGREHSWQSGYI
jgi:ADP-heptose:LPS heptosyltransferase